MKNALVFTILILFASSCIRNYQKELEHLVAKYEEEGKRILATSTEKHFVIYKDNDAFWINNLDTPARKIISSEKEMKEKMYFLQFDEVGKPYIESKTCKMRLDKAYFQESTVFNEEEAGSVDSYKKDEIQLLNDDALAFVYRFVNEYRAGCAVQENRYIYYFSNPDTLFYSHTQPVMHADGCRSDKVDSYASNLADAVIDDPIENDVFPFTSYANQGEGGYFSWEFKVDSHGMVIDTSDYLEYNNEMYHKHMTFTFSDFSSKKNCVAILKTLNDTITKCMTEQAIKELKKEAIPLNELGKIYRNQVAADRKYKNETITVICKFEELVKPDLFEPNYKYKLCSEYDPIFLLNYNVEAYTNDENAVSLTFPAKVIMRAKLIRGSQTSFEFRDCELLMLLE